MFARNNEDAEISFVCEIDETTWHVEGRFNAEGDFEAFDETDLPCPECGSLESAYQID